MKTNLLRRKYATLCVISILLMSLNIFATVCSTATKNDDDGTWFDNFDDLLGVSETQHCNYSDEGFKLNLTKTHNYDFDDWQEHLAWESDSIIKLDMLSTVLSMKNPKNETKIDDTKLKRLDGNVIETSSKVMLLSFSPVHHFTFNTRLNPEDIETFKLSWFYGNNSGDANIKSVKMYAWRYLIPIIQKVGFYEEIAELSSYSDIGLNPDGDICITINDTQYVSSDGNIDILVVGVPENLINTGILKTDYIKITADTSVDGYIDKGYVTSNEIKPDDLGRWESVVWPCPEANEITSVKIQILDKYGELIDDSYLPGNSEGFTTSPLDLSPLAGFYGSIKLNATLISSKPSDSPRLDSWGVTWHTSDNKFIDEFNTDLRIDILSRVEVSNGTINATGNYTPDQVGRVVSFPINVPYDKWWDEFRAVNNSEGAIRFSILDSDFNILIDNITNKADISDSSVLNTRTIRLAANFSRENNTENPELDSWSVTWKDNNQPVLRGDTFKPSPDGWINTNTPICTVKAYDTMPGLDVDFTRYKISYENDNGDEVTSNWISANCTGEKGTISNQTITADTSKFENSGDISILRSITISISDLAGYETTISKTFKLDTEKPVSNIKNTDDFEEKYNDPVTIEASAIDKVSGNVSGVNFVTLYYKLKNDDTWLEYGKVSSPYSWEFKRAISGEYEFCVIATDHAGNVEDKEKQAAISFTFDMNNPEKPEFGECRVNKIPKFSIDFTDDYILESAEYRLNFYGMNQWIVLGKNLSENKHSFDWNLSNEDWDMMDEGKEYFMYFRIIDVCGNAYETDENIDALKIVKDFTVCKSYIDLSDFEEIQWDNFFTIYTNIPDDGNISSVELYYRYSEDNTKWSNWEKYDNALTSAPYEWEFTAENGNGHYEFKTKVVDAAGNVGESPINSISVHLFPVALAAILVIIAIALIAISIAVIFKKKKENR